MELDFHRTTRKPRQVALIPLIDVMFVLLLFFMIAGHLEVISPLPVMLPEADSGQLLDEGPVKVSMATDGRILVNEGMFNSSTVQSELSRQLVNNKERIITIKADANLEANKLVTLLEQVRQAGGVNLSIVTDSGGGI